ncbi:MAG: UbiH/UbiF/VisC/COQ6 family ubiquinone biosynthesis hydroxylase [Pseudomonadales bacterium]
MSVKHFDLIIIGAGMAGLALANSVRDSAMKVALIEARPLDAIAPKGVGNFKQLGGQPCDLGDFDPRVSALTPASIKFFQRLGIWGNIESQRHCSFVEMQVWDAQGVGGVRFTAEEMGADSLGCIVENSVTLQALREGIATASNLSLFCPNTLAELESSGESGPDEPLQLIKLDDGMQLAAPLIVAADGGNSQLRKLANFESKAWSYDQSAIVATVQTEKPHDRVALQRFMPGGPLAFLPLAGKAQNLCSIVWSLDNDLVEEKLVLDEPEFCRVLERAFESRLGRIMASSRRYSFPLRQQHATDYVKEGVALIGDAAHVIHPLAGQGVNLGFADVEVLGEELLRAFESGETLAGDLFLQRYQRRRKADNLTMMVAVEGFKRLFGRQELPIVWLRNAGMRQLNRAAPLKRQIVRHAMGL